MAAWMDALPALSASAPEKPSSGVGGPHRRAPLVGGWRETRLPSRAMCGDPRAPHSAWDPRHTRLPPSCWQGPLAS